MTEIYKPKKKTKGVGLKKGQRLQVTTGKPGILSAPSKGPSMSREALATVSKHIAPYSDKAKKKIVKEKK